jgi:hypothetical protein
MPPVGFEPAISADKRPQTYALDLRPLGLAGSLIRYSYMPCPFAVSSYTHSPTGHTHTHTHTITQISNHQAVVLVTFYQNFLVHAEQIDATASNQTVASLLERFDVMLQLGSVAVVKSRTGHHLCLSASGRCRRRRWPTEESEQHCTQSVVLTEHADLIPSPAFGHDSQPV